MKSRSIVCVLAAAIVAAAASGQAITNGRVSVAPIGVDGAYSGFRVTAGREPIADVTFGSVGNITASRMVVGEGRTAMSFTGLASEPTPRLARGSSITVRLFADDPYPRVEFSLDMSRFSQERWQAHMGEVPFHFLSVSVPGAEIFHQRGWPIPTPVIDDYPLHNTGTGYGVQIRSFWSKDWTYAPPVGAYPLATAGLWTPSKRHYVAYDFHEARFTDHSERDVATAYCWRLEPKGEQAAAEAAREFVTLVWPYARPYQKLRYPEPGRHTVASHFRILYSLDMPGDSDPNRFVTRFIWERFAEHMPGVPRVNDVSWLTAPYRYDDFEIPRAPWVHARVAKSQWWKPGAVVLGGVIWDGDPITYVYEKKQAGAIKKLQEDVDFVLRYTRRMKIAGDDCCFWPKPLEGEGPDMFGPAGVPTIRNIQGWQFALTLLDICRNDPGERERLLPYVDGALRFTRHILYTRNGYADVPCAQFCWGAGPVTSFCLRYHYTFRGDPTRGKLAQTALELAHTMLYRYLPIWASDSNPTDELDSAFMLEPNSGISWLGASCSNEVWVVPHAVAQVYVATGDPALGHYLRGMIERWHWMFRDEYYPKVAAYDTAFTERLGLYDGSARAHGTRDTFGGLHGFFERYCWPLGSARARVLCGEKAAMAFNKGGRHTDVADYRYYGNGAFSLRVVPTAEWCKQPEPFDLVVTFPYFDLRSSGVSCTGKGAAQKLGDERVKRYAQRPDTITVRGLHYGDTVSVGADLDPSVKPLPRAVARERGAFELPAKVAGFTLVPMARHCKKRLTADWDDPNSWAGLPAGRIWRYGVPLDMIDPVLNEGRRAARDTAIPVGQEASYVFALVANAGADASVEVVYSRGRRRSVALDEAVPTLKGWPPCFEWHADLLAVPTRGRRVEAIECRGVDLLAVTAFSGDKRKLAATFEALEAKREAVVAERRAVAKFAALAPLFEKLSGRIAVLPQPRTKNPQNIPLVHMLHQAGLLKHVALLSQAQLVDPRVFNPEKVWVALYLGGEDYPGAVHRKGDAAEALRRYMRAGGTILSMAQQPFPFYYATVGKEGKPAIIAGELGFPICGSGALDRDDRIKAAKVGGWEKPPGGVKLTFHRNPEQKIITGLPKKFPFPTEEGADPRWRPIVNVVDEANVYTPILTLRDNTGQSHGDAAALIEYEVGPLKGARTAYVWSTLVKHPEYQSVIAVDMLRYILSTAQPPLARHTCVRASGPIRVDGKLDEPAWAEAGRAALAHCFVTRQGVPPLATTARLLWDDANLYVAFECEDTDAFGREASRDSELWEEEVVEVYVDPEGDGKDYLEFEVNPRNAIIDLKIPSAEQVKGKNYMRFRTWNAEGWKTAVQVNGTVDNRDDTDRGWTAEMAIPLSDLAQADALPPRPGATWRVQLYRIERAKSLGDKPMFAAWSPTEKFHDPTRFGLLVFGSNPAHEDFALYPDGSNASPTWQACAGAWRVEKGQLIGEDCASDGWQVLGICAGRDEWRDYRLKLRFKILELGSDGRDGPWIAFRHTAAGSCYSLNLGRATQLHKSYAGRSTNDQTCLAAKAWQPDHEWHTLEVVVQGNHITTRLDAKPLLEATDADHLGVKPVPAGGIALSARRWSQSKGHTRVAFDHIEVEPLAP